MKREIVFSARDNGVTSFMDKMKRSAVDVGRGILQDSVDQSSSAKEAIKNYEAQISLIEKKNRLQRDASRIAAEQSRDRKMSGADSELDRKKATSDFRSEVKDINSSAKEDQLQVELLRELIRTVKNTANQELRSDSVNSQRESDDLERYLGDEDSSEFRNVANRLRDESTPTQDSDSKVSSSNNLVAGASSIANQQEGTGAIQRTLDAVGKGPILGTIAGIVAIAVAGLNIRAQREKSAEKLAGMTGIDNRSILNSQLGSTDFFNGYGPNTLGVSREEFLGQYVPGTMQASGTMKSGGYRAMRNLELEKALGLDGGTADSMTRLGRAAGDLDSHKMANAVYSSMYGTGAFGSDNNDMTRMQDLLSGLTGFGEGELARAGVVTGGGTLQLRRGLEQLGGRFTRDDYSLQTMQGLNAGLTSEGSPEARAIKFDVLRRQNPNMSMFELQNQMDQGINSKGYLQGMLDFVKGTGGDLNSQSFLLDGLTGGQMRGKDITSILKGDLSLEEYDKKDLGIKDRAYNSTSRANEQLLNFTEQFKDLMSGIGGGVESALETLKGIDTTMKSMEKGINKLVEAIN